MKEQDRFDSEVSEFVQWAYARQDNDRRRMTAPEYVFWRSVFLNLWGKFDSDGP